MADMKAPTRPKHSTLLEENMSTSYSLRVSNESSLAGSICIYQTFDEMESMKDLFPLAWFSKGCNPATQVKFAWSIDYAFSWSESGALVPGVTFDASQTSQADPSRLGPNSITLTHTNIGYTFIDPIRTAPWVLSAFLPTIRCP